MEQKINSVTSAETNDEVSANVEVSTSSPNNAKPNVGGSLCLTEIDKLCELKKILNYTYSSFELNVIKFYGSCFVYFNDVNECIEIHSPGMFEFKQKGKLNKETLLFSIDYKHILEEKLAIEFNKNGKIEKISFGFFKPVFTFWGFSKKTSHSIGGEYKGLFTVENGFELYHLALNDGVV